MGSWNYWFVAAAVAAASCSSAMAQSSAGAPTISSERIFYFNGDSRVDLDLALDAVNLETSDSAVFRSARSTGRISVASESKLNASRQGGQRAVDVRFAAPATSRADLETRVHGIIQSGEAAHAVTYATGAAHTEERLQVLTSRLAVKLRGGQDVGALAGRYGLSVIEKVAYSPNTYILEAADGSGLLAALDAANSLKQKDNVEFATPVLVRQRQKRAIPDDTYFTRQWHLLNTGFNPGIVGAIAGNDDNLTPAWDNDRGAGVNIAISDDGLETDHPDLAPNCRTDIDIDLVDGDNDPSPVLASDIHGTACAGLAAGRGFNGVGICGAAPEAGLVGVRLIGANESDETEAEAMAHQSTPANAADRVSVNSNSWGPSDDGATLQDSGPLWKAAVQAGITNGRGGKGIIYTWAGGNGLQDGDDANYDGYANCPDVIAFGASGADGKQSYYSEDGANLLLNACSSYNDASGFGEITTVDRVGTAGYNSGSAGNLPDDNYTDTFGGTSAAAPVAAGVVALVIQANPNLTYRDVQHVLVDTATKNDPTDGGWVTNGAGKPFSHKYGHGRINAGAAVVAAATWTNVPAAATPLTAANSTAAAIPDNSTTGIARSVTLSAPSNFVVEHVTFKVNATHGRRGDLDWTLTSPAGTISHVPSRSADNGADYSNWTFSSTACWGENPNGTWTLIVANVASGITGTLSDWTLTVYGYLTPPTSASDWALY